MTRKELIDVLKSIEEKYPVDEWIIDDINIWPLIKFDIFGRWRQNQNTSYNDLLNSASKKENLVVQVTKSITSMCYLAKLLIKKTSKNTVIFTGSNSHRILYEDHYINRYFEPIIESLRDSYEMDSIIIDYNPEDKSKLYKSKNSLVFLDKYIYAVKIVTFFKNLRINIKADKLRDFSLFINEVNSRIPKLELSDLYLKVLLRKIKVIKSYGYIYDIFLRKYSPKYIMCLCYYNSICYGMNYAAYKRGITSIDMQHGGQGPLHPAYSDFNKVPSKGYNLLPKIFWCWDAPSMQTILNWSSNQSFHQVILGGNPWLSYFLNSNDSTFVFTGKKIILYTLQLNEPEEYIIEAIKNTPDDYEWWLRLHPRTLNVISHIESLLIKENIVDKVEIKKAISYPLPQILLKSAIHISRSSGSVIEAAQLGLKTIIIHEIGVENYKEYIDNGDAIPFLSEDSTELLKLIVQNSSESKAVSDSSLYREALRNLV